MEVELVKRLFEELSYELEKTSGEQIEEAYALIEGFNQFPEFNFYDSSPIYFEHTRDRAVLRLDYYGVKAELVFTGVLDIEVVGDPANIKIKLKYRI